MDKPHAHQMSDERNIYRFYECLICGAMFKDAEGTVLYYESNRYT